MPHTIVDHLQVAASLGRGLADFARERGVAIEPVASALGLKLNVFQQLDARISLDRMARLFETLAMLSGDETFGLHYGEVFEQGGSGPFGYGLKSAPDMRAAINFFDTFVTLLIDLDYANSREDDGDYIFEWGFAPQLRRIDQLNDFIVCATIQNLRGIGGEDWTAKEVYLRRPPPVSITEYRRLIAAQAHFDAPFNAIVVKSSELSQVNENSNPILFEMMTKNCRSLLAALPKTVGWVRRVENEIHNILGRSPLTAPVVAKRLGVSSRSLQRRLAENDASFQTLVDGVRRERSDQLLRDSDLPIGEVALKLGFSCASAYTRSASRWYDATPTAMREKLRSRRSGGIDAET